MMFLGVELLKLMFLIQISPVQSSQRSSGCPISIDGDVNKILPLILLPGREYGNDAFYLPDADGNININNNGKLTLACPGSNLILRRANSKSAMLRAKCSNNKFEIGDKTLRFSEISCGQSLYHTARYTGDTCLSRHFEIEIGFVLERRFLRQLLICFDKKFQTTLYSEFNLTKNIAGYQREYPRPTWIEGNFYSLGSSKLNDLYTRDSQRSTINDLVGLHRNTKKYIDDNSDYYLARGHLAAKTDFVYGSQQMLTFYLVNVAPQWQTFNSKNWLSLESSIRKFASNSSRNFIVYTGTHGVTSLPHKSTGRHVELYLYVNRTTRAIPVPRLFWKVLYDPVSYEGFAFVGVNNPYVLQPNKDVICKDISYKYKWLTWKPKDMESGYSYSCNLNEFRRKIKNFPHQEIRFFSGVACSFVRMYYLYFIIIILSIRMS